MAKYIAEIDHEIDGIPCIIGVIEYEPYVPGYISGPPENCYPDEGGISYWELLKVTGQPYSWLNKQLSNKDISDIEDVIFENCEAAIKSSRYENYFDSLDSYSY